MVCCFLGLIVVLCDGEFGSSVGFRQFICDCVVILRLVGESGKRAPIRGLQELVRHNFQELASVPNRYCLMSFGLVSESQTFSVFALMVMLVVAVNAPFIFSPLIDHIHKIWIKSLPPASERSDACTRQELRILRRAASSMGYFSTGIMHCEVPSATQFSALENCRPSQSLKRAEMSFPPALRPADSQAGR